MSEQLENEVAQLENQLADCHQQDRLKTNEINALVKENRHLHAELEAIGNALLSTDYTVTGEEGLPITHPTNSVHRAKFLINERAQLRHKLEATKAELEKANACCAEARAHIQSLIDVLPHEKEGVVRAMVGAAARTFLLSHTCGTALLEELRELRALKQGLFDYLDGRIKYVNGFPALTPAHDAYHNILMFLRSFKAKHEKTNL